MKLIPILSLGWQNGWLGLVILYGIFGVLLLIFPREVVQRLYDRSGWDPGRRPYIVAGKLLALAGLLLLVFSPLQWETAVFSIGLALFTLGLAIFVAALIVYSRTPLDQPARRGVYRYSRNPQILGIMLALLGLAVATGSWLTLLLFLAAQVLHYFFTIRAEEEACLAQYGESYRRYMDQVPRYFGPL